MGGWVEGKATPKEGDVAEVVGLPGDGEPGREVPQKE